MAEVPERVLTRSQLVEEAIDAALNREWQTALDLNLEVVDRFGTDEETNNRLGKAYTELGKLDDALGAYRATLEMNPLNGIALKNVNRLEALIQEKADVPKAQAAVDMGLFVEEMGKTALATVVPERGFDAALVAAGDQVDLVPVGDTLWVQTVGKVRIGHVEAKLARRVLKFIAGGNQYSAAVAQSDDKGVRVIIRETYQAPELAGQPSFPVRKASEFRAYAKDSLLRDGDIDTGLDDEDGDGDGIEGGDEDLEGMHAVDPGMEDADLSDDDSRAEDSY